MTGAYELNVKAPPFVIGTGSPQETAQAMADTYTAIEANNVAIVDVWNAATMVLDLSERSPEVGGFVRAGKALAQAIDGGEGAGLAGGYHNAQHFKEVILNATQLLLRNQSLGPLEVYLSPKDEAKVLFAALAHDFNYETGGNNAPDGKPAPYRLEHISFSSARPYLEEEGVHASHIQEIGVLLYGTDVSPASDAGKFVRAANKHLFEGAPKPAVNEVLDKVAPVLGDRNLARMSAILGDADIFSSAGLTPAYNDVQSARLGAELGRTLGPSDKIWFLKNIVGDRFMSPGAQFFQPNMDSIREQAQAKLNAESSTMTPASPPPPKP